MEKVKVTELTMTYTKGADRYGPFKATADKPFIEVPLSIALASSAPVYDGEVAQPKQAGDSTSVDDLLQANADLKADLDRATGERDDLKNKVDGLENALVLQRKKVEEWADLANDNSAKVTNLTLERDKVTTELAAAQARILELESAAPAETGNPVTPPAGTPLVDGLPNPDLLTSNGFDTMEKLEAGLKVLEGAKESAVEAIDGIGKKSLEAYAKAVADWKAGK